MITDQGTINERLQHCITLASSIKNLFTEDVAITISDHEKIIEHIDSKEFSLNFNVGQYLQQDQPMAKVIQYNNEETYTIPEDVFGVTLEVRIVPIRDNDIVIGSIAITSLLNRQLKLSKVAEKFAASSEEISASTEELSIFAFDLNTYMLKLAEAQEDMNQQVDNTTKILDMINSVAKNTRILGFNAGIEAARSGEYGRGFSVVAKEITKLADQSAESVKDIRQLLDALKEKVQQVALVIRDSVEISRNQSASIEEISKNIQSLAQVAEDIEEMSKKL